MFQFALEAFTNYAKILLLKCFFFNWDSLHARLNSLIELQEKEAQKD